MLRLATKMVPVEEAKLIDKDDWLNTLSLDAHLVTAIMRGAAKGDVRAIQLGYQRLGLMRNGEFLKTTENNMDRDRLPQGSRLKKDLKRSN